jgi:hypothetical protein
MALRAWDALTADLETQSFGFAVTRLVMLYLMTHLMLTDGRLERCMCTSRYGLSRSAKVCKASPYMPGVLLKLV